MKDQMNREEVTKTSEPTVREPLFRKYQIKVKAGLRVGAVPTGHPPLGF